MHRKQFSTKLGSSDLESSLAKCFDNLKANREINKLIQTEANYSRANCSNPSNLVAVHSTFPRDEVHIPIIPSPYKSANFLCSICLIICPVQKIFGFRLSNHT